MRSAVAQRLWVPAQSLSTASQFKFTPIQGHFSGDVVAYELFAWETN